MVIDDTPANLTLLAEMLDTHGYRVCAFPRGRLALTAARQAPPDLILLDITMPEMDGFAVCSALQADPLLRQVPVIFISAHTEMAEKVKAFDLGGVDFITKPFHAAEVLARIQTHLQLRRYRQELEQMNRHLQTMVTEQVQEIADAQMSTILALSKLAESRDDDTGRHLERVQRYCRLLAAHLQQQPAYQHAIDEAFLRNLVNASPLHDIGKVGIPDTILLRPGPLSAEEMATMRTHTTIGAQTLEAVQAIYPHNAFIGMGIMIARSHHERWDGTGYPEGLAGAAIPLPARLVALADVYDALRSTRCYKAAYSHTQSCAIILEGRGTQFDPALVEAFTHLAPAFDQIRTTLDDA